MPEAFEIIVENQLITGKRDLNVYVNSSRSAHIISSGSSAALTLKSAGEGDYIHVSVVKGPGDMLKETLIHIPSWADFQCEAPAGLSLFHLHSPDGEGIQLKIPPGPVWELKITKPGKVPGSSRLAKKGNYLKIAEGN